MNLQVMFMTLQFRTIIQLVVTRVCQLALLAAETGIGVMKDTHAQETTIASNQDISIAPTTFQVQLAPCPLVQLAVTMVIIVQADIHVQHRDQVIYAAQPPVEDRAMVNQVPRVHHLPQLQEIP